MKLRISLPESAPVAEKIPVEQTAHGITRSDDYAWLRADNWQEAMRDPDKLPHKIKTYLEAENDYCAEAMQYTEQLQEALVAEMRGRIQEQDEELPVLDGAYAYCERYVEGGEHPIYYRTDRSFDHAAGKANSNVGDKADHNEELLIDINSEAGEHEYFSHYLVEHSPDHKTLAWSCDTSGAEYYRLFFRDIASGQDSATVIEDVESAAWANDSTIYYTRVDENHRTSKVFRHVIGSDPAEDELIYHEKDNRFYCDVERSRSGKYIFISTGMDTQDEVWCIAIDDPESKMQLIEPRSEGFEYSVDHWVNDTGDFFIILSNCDEAKDFKLSVTSVNQPGREHWSDFQAYKPGCMIHSFEVYRDWVMWLAVENALPAIYFVGSDGKVSKLAFEEEAYSLGLDAGLEYDVSLFRFDYSSPTTPWQTWEYDCATAQRRHLKSQVIPSGHDPSDYITRRVSAQSHDGAEVPVTLLHHKDTKIDGTAPCLLYGYGSYGSSVPAGFSSNRLSLVDRGFVYAIAHVRGGEEKGRDWYEQARFAGKVNSFQDFIAAAEVLIENQYTASANVVIHGASAGGLLVGATVNMRPDLFAGVIADVPFVDVLNTIIDDSLPLTPGEWSQWGNPIESEESYHAIAGYSPYDHVEAKEYPSMLVTAGVSDPRVTYWEPAKWVAKLRDLKKDSNPLMLKTNMSSGHYGKTGRFAMLEDYALSYAFALVVTELPAVLTAD